ncbi:MAG TPA: hypothetical protein DDX04_09790 [Massilia sp.]|nr:hypothetical protein [Massilia sp.]
MRKLVTAWAVLTLVACVGIYCWLGSLPPDEFDLANTAGFKVMLSLLVVGGGAVGTLFVFLFFGSIVLSLFRSRDKRPH